MEIVNLDILEPTGGHGYACEASTAGFPPGKFPAELEVTPKIGNGMKFIAGKTMTTNGEVYAVEYIQMFGISTLVVYND